MKGIERAIMHFEYVKRNAVAVLDSGFGTKPNECSIVYKNQKLYAELAINALKKQIPTNPVKKNPIVYAMTIDGDVSYSYDYHCPLCDEKLKLSEHHCPCGQALDWSDTE